VVRGGSFNNNQDNAACAYRNNNNPRNSNNNNGFRCAMTLLVSAALFAAEGARRPLFNPRTAAACCGDVQTAGPVPALLWAGQR
jgi:hypothetical protein